MNSRRLFIHAAMVFSVLATGFEGQSARAQTASTMQWLRAEVKEGTASGWFRWAVDPAVADSEAVHLMIVSDQHVSLYVNGQRILKNRSLPKSDQSVSASGFNVKSLLRQGRNMIAVEVNSDSNKAAFGISVLAAKGAEKKTIGGPWKIASAMPPVGWQQTDFNDRDWPEAKPVADEPGDRFTVTAPSEFVASVIAAKARTAPFQFEDGDRVVFVGATFFERAQLFEHLESTLTATLGQKNVTFRNLGWDGDTVFAYSRGIFDRPDVGYLRMVEHIRAEEPTVAFICYGQNEALTSGMTPERYSDQLGRLLDELAASGIACVLVSPHELLPAMSPIPSPSRFNGRIKAYADATAGVAKSRGLLYVDLMTDFQARLLEIDGQLLGGTRKSQQDAFVSLSDNGIHFTDYGYQCASLIFRERLLSIPAEATGMDSEKYEKMRTLVRRKNELYFHRWRPQNITYLFGFRKHEQGNNAADIAKFDPFILDLEKQIHELQ
jgi:lysophospholipase L1-like esterase